MATYGTPATTKPMAPAQNHFADAAQKGETTQISALQCLQYALSDCHNRLDYLHALADRIVGIRGEKAESAPDPVPNGMLDENILSARAVHERLAALCERLSLIA